MKFYPSDWQADQALRLVSLAARGLWIECMCIMHKAEPYGHLVVNGRPVTDAQLGVLAGAPPARITEILGELEAAGVFSRTKQGVVFSRRMTRDEKRASLSRKNGKKGGNPSLCKDKENLARVNPPDNGGDKAQKPEARSQNTTLHRAGETTPDQSIVLPAVLVIQAFDAAIIDAWGAELRRPWPSATDKTDADRWLSSGITPEDAAALFRERMAEMARRGRSPPKNLKYFENAIPDLLAAKNNPAPEASHGKPAFNGKRPSSHETMYSGFAQAARDLENGSDIFG